MFGETSSPLPEKAVVTTTFPKESKVTPEQQQSKEKRWGLSATVRGYAEKKTSDPDRQKEIIQRVVDVGTKGAKAVRENIKKMFPTEIATVDSDQQNPEAQAVEPQPYEKRLIAEQAVVLEGQLIAEVAAGAETNTTLKTPEEKQKFIENYTKSVRDLVVDATRTITYQDTLGSAVTLGDHGWMHLTQDARDATVIAEGKRGAPLSAKEKFMVGLAAAYHDVGYTVDGVNDQQRASGGVYKGEDIGHPVTSHVYMLSQSEKFRNVLGEKATRGLQQMVATHENPDLAEQAGEYALIAESFALADASAAFGMDKLPPVLVQIPETLAYMKAMSMAQTKEFAVIYERISEPRPSFEEAQNMFNEQVVQKLKNAAYAAIDARISHKAPTSGDGQEQADTALYQADALKNAVDHFGPRSEAFLLNRTSVEPARLYVDDQKRVCFDLNAGFARNLDSKGVAPGATYEASKLTVKLFCEQAALNPSESVKEVLTAVLFYGKAPEAPQLQALTELGISVDAVMKAEPEKEDSYVELATTAIVIRSYTHRAVSAPNADFYSTIEKNYGAAVDAAKAFKEQFNQ